MYAPENQSEEDRVLNNDMEELAEFSKMNDFSGFWLVVSFGEDMKDQDGKVLLDATGKVRRHEIFNFGKYKGWDVAEVLRKDPGYYTWMLASVLHIYKASLDAYSFKGV